MAYDDGRPRPKRRWVGLVVALGVFLGLVVAAGLIGEKLARDLATDLVTDQVAAALALDADTGVDVEFGSGSLVLQAFGGSIDTVTVSVTDATLGPASGDVTLTATDVPLDLKGAVDGLTATMSFGAPAMQALAPTLTDAPVTAIDLVGTQLQITSSATVLGVDRPVLVSLTPAAQDGLVVFTVDAITVDGQPVDVAQAQAGAYGAGPSQLATPRSLCLANYLPAALTLSGAQVVKSELQVVFTGRNVSLAGGGLGTKGECPTEG